VVVASIAKEEIRVSVENTFPRESRRTAGPSTALRSGRDDKGGGVALPENRNRFSSPWVGKRPMIPLSKKHFQEGTAEPQISPLRSPGFPVETRGFDDLHAALFTESRTRGRR
jgi:hypothetical protein